MQTIVNMYRYSWLITFEIFHIFFFWIEGWVGGVNCIQTFFGFLDFFIFTRSLRFYETGCFQNMANDRNQSAQRIRNYPPSDECHKTTHEPLGTQANTMPTNKRSSFYA